MSPQRASLYVTGHAGALATLGDVAELVAQLREAKDRAGDQRFDS